MAIARHLWVSDLVENPFSLGTINVDAYGAGLAVCLALAAFLLVVTGWYNRRDFDVQGRIIRMIVSAIKEIFPFHTRTDFSFGRPIFPLLVLAIVEVDNWLIQKRPSTTSGVQWLGFAIAYLTTTDITWVASSIALTSKETSYTPIPSFKNQDEPADETKSPISETMDPHELTCASEYFLLRHISVAWHALLGALALLLVFYSAVGALHTDPGRRSWDLDIVIAWYDEPVEQVVRTAQLALDLPCFCKPNRTIPAIFKLGWRTTSSARLASYHYRMCEIFVPAATRATTIPVGRKMAQYCGTYLGGRTHTKRSRLLSDERFGFTLERSWGTIFQCPRISERCPTLLSGWIGNRAAVEDCQCVDKVL